MRFILLSISVYLACVLETVLGPIWMLGSVGPDLLAVVMIVWTMTNRTPAVFLAGGAIGILSDLVSGVRIGTAAFAFLLVAYGLSAACGTFRVRGLSGKIALAGAALLILELAIGTVSWISGCWVSSLAVGLGPSVGGNAGRTLAMTLSQSAGVALYSTAVTGGVLLISGWFLRTRSFAARHNLAWATHQS
jgi:rod shape-determining protein MreD